MRRPTLLLPQGPRPGRADARETTINAARRCASQSVLRPEESVLRSWRNPQLLHHTQSPFKMDRSLFCEDGRWSTLPEGQEAVDIESIIHSVWAYNEENQWAVLTTVYRPDPKRWIDWRTRRH